MYVTDVIKDNYKDWKEGQNVFISADTGTGKTTFVLNELSSITNSENRILYLCNRHNLRAEIKDKIDSLSMDEIINKDDIVVVTYQSTDDFIDALKTGVFRPFKYIVCDECHYFITDAAFNEDTHYFFDYLLDCDSCKIWITATHKHIFPYIKERLTEESKEDSIVKEDYHVEQEYKHVSKVCFYGDKQYRADRINAILAGNPDAHIVLFTSRIPQARYLDEKFGNRYELLISESNEKYINASASQRRKIDETRQHLIENHCQRRNILITTSVLDNGINLEDKNLVAVFCEILPPESVIQCLGRKRDSGGEIDTCRFYVYIQSEKYMRSLLAKDKEILSRVNEMNECLESGISPKRYKDKTLGAEYLLDDITAGDLKGYFAFKSFFPSFNLVPNRLKQEWLKRQIEYLEQMIERGYEKYLQEEWFNDSLKRKCFYSNCGNAEKAKLSSLPSYLYELYKGIWFENDEIEKSDKK